MKTDQPVLGITSTSTPLTPWIRDAASLWVCAASQRLLAGFPARGLSRCKSASMSFGKASLALKKSCLSKFNHILFQKLYISYYHIVRTAWRMANFPKSVGTKISPFGQGRKCRTSKASCCSASSSVRPSLMARLGKMQWVRCISMHGVFVPPTLNMAEPSIAVCQVRRPEDRDACRLRYLRSVHKMFHTQSSLAASE